MKTTLFRFYFRFLWKNECRTFKCLLAINLFCSQLGSQSDFKCVCAVTWNTLKPCVRNLWQNRCITVRWLCVCMPAYAYVYVRIRVSTLYVRNVKTNGAKKHFVFVINVQWCNVWCDAFWAWFRARQMHLRIKIWIQFTIRKNKCLV